MYRDYGKEEFENNIKTQNFVRLRNTVSNVIRCDPAFQTTELEEIICELDAKVPNIFVEYQLQDGEPEKLTDPTAWTKDYFSSLIFWFTENFSKKRLKHIKEVGEKIYADNNISDQKKNVTPQQRSATHPSSKFSLLLLLVILGLIIMVITQFRK